MISTTIYLLQTSEWQWVYNLDREKNTWDVSSKITNAQQFTFRDIDGYQGVLEEIYGFTIHYVKQRPWKPPAAKIQLKKRRK